jgi:hypothetical protein
MNAHPVALIDAHEIGIQEQTNENNGARDHDEQDTLENVGLHRRFSGRVGNCQWGGKYSSGILYAGKSYVYCAQVLVCGETIRIVAPKECWNAETCLENEQSN